MAMSELNLCQQVLDGLRAAKILSKTEDIKVILDLMMMNGFSSSERKTVFYAVTLAGLEGQFDDDVGLD